MKSLYESILDDESKIIGKAEYDLDRAVILSNVVHVDSEDLSKLIADKKIFIDDDYNLIARIDECNRLSLNLDPHDSSNYISKIKSIRFISESRVNPELGLLNIYINDKNNVVDLKDCPKIYCDNTKPCLVFPGQAYKNIIIKNFDEKRILGNKPYELLIHNGFGIRNDHAKLQLINCDMSSASELQINACDLSGISDLPINPDKIVMYNCIIGNSNNDAIKELFARQIFGVVKDIMFDRPIYFDSVDAENAAKRQITIKGDTLSMGNIAYAYYSFTQNDSKSKYLKQILPYIKNIESNGVIGCIYPQDVSLITKAEELRVMVDKKSVSFDNFSSRPKIKSYRIISEITHARANTSFKAYCDESRETNNPNTTTSLSFNISVTFENLNNVICNCQALHIGRNKSIGLALMKKLEELGGDEISTEDLKTVIPLDNFKNLKFITYSIATKDKLIENIGGGIWKIKKRR